MAENLKPSTTRQPEEISVLQWNARNTTPNDRIERHYRGITAQLGEPDITCREEVMRDDAEPETGFAINHQFRARTPYLFAALKGRVEGITIESTFERVHYKEIELSNGDPTMYLGALATRRVCQLASFFVPAWGEEVHVTHAHLSPKIPVLNSRQRRAERDNLIDIAREQAERGRFMLTGDFNATPDSELLRALSELEGVQLLNNKIPTHRAQWGRVAVSRTVLDHMLVSSDLKGHVQVLEAGPSDHNPVLSTIRRNE